MALKDAEKACKLEPKSAKAQGRRAYALYLLEDFARAREAYLEGLHQDPTNKNLQEGLVETDNILQKSTRKSKTSSKGESGAADSNKNIFVLPSEDFECMLCFKLFYEPVTTSCGHTFCKSCLLRSMDYGNRCPSCRCVLFITESKLAVNVTLRNIMEKHFTEEYKARAEEEKAKQVDQGTGKAIIPLFVMDVVLPLQRIALNIFEPRYRLLIRRAMSGSRTFGMIGLDRRGANILEVGCEVQIEERNCLPDGRFEIEVIGHRRFKVNRCEEQDGYRLAHAEYITDRQVEGEQSMEEVSALASEVDQKIETFINRIRSQRGCSSAVLNALIRCTGKKPVKTTAATEAKYCEDLSFYTGTILSSLQAVSASAILQMLSTKDRLALLSNSSVLNL